VQTAEIGEWGESGEGGGDAAAGERGTWADTKAAWPGLEALADRVQSSLDLESGPTVRMVLATRGGRPYRLLVVAHHLGVDAVSWSVLVQDLNTAYQQAAAEEPVTLPAKTSSYRKWLDHLHEHLRDEQVEASRAHWEETLGEPGDAVLPVELPDGPATVRDSAHARAVLSPRLTRALLQDTAAAYRTRPDEVVLTALALAVRDLTGARELTVNMENNGRHPFTDEMDLSRTVGWFTAAYPVRLTLPEDPHDLGTALMSVKERLRTVPHHGLSYGLLRHLHPVPLNPAAEPSLSFNYLGGLMAPGAGGEAPFTAAPEPSGISTHPDNTRTEPISVLVMVAEDYLEVAVSYLSTRYRKETMDALAREIESRLTALIEHCLDPAHHGATSSDFPLANLSQRSLDRIMNRLDT
jgi:non-ribosomal peptide synthase protein (TIGR01720 family)